MVNNHGYVYIERWGRFLGSRDYFIQDQCDLAAGEHAPHNAIYPRQQPGALGHQSEDGWATTDDVTNPDALDVLGL
jgi:hypothetical protein